jgi:hypothetical protein
MADYNHNLSVTPKTNNNSFIIKSSSNVWSRHYQYVTKKNLEQNVVKKKLNCFFVLVTINDFNKNISKNK